MAFRDLSDLFLKWVDASGDGQVYVIKLFIDFEELLVNPGLSFLQVFVNACDLTLILSLCLTKFCFECGHTVTETLLC